MAGIIETERLILSKLCMDDVHFIKALVNSPGWLQYIGDRNIHTEEDALAYLVQGPLKSYADDGFGLYRVDLKTDGRPIGICGILRRSTLEHPDLGFAFLPEFEGFGYAYESASATLKYAREILKLPTILAITMVGNMRSVGLLGKLGFEDVKEEKGLLTLVYQAPPGELSIACLEQ